jgi:uncharacterized protein
VRVPALLLLIAALSVPSARAADPPRAEGAASAAGNAAQMPSLRKRQSLAKHLKSAEGLTYTIFLSVPEGPPPAAGFPVLYVLDANAWFGLAAEMTRLYELEGGPAIVVGVGYDVDTLYDPPRRAHDFTLGPPPVVQPPYHTAAFGGADAFLRFLRADLRDDLARSYPIDLQRQALFGHSLGGYFALYALFTQPDSFAVITAASPAIWWDPKRLADAERSFIGRRSARPSVLVAVGAQEQKLGPEDRRLFEKLYTARPAMFGGKTLPAVLAETQAGLAKNRMVDNARELAKRLQKARVAARFVLFEGENHRSEVAPALGRTLRLALQ